MNYYPHREGHMPMLDAATLTSSELVQQHLNGAKLVKALHNQYAPPTILEERSACADTWLRYEPKGGP